MFWREVRQARSVVIVASKYKGIATIQKMHFKLFMDLIWQLSEQAVLNLKCFVSSRTSLFYADYFPAAFT